MAKQLKPNLFIVGAPKSATTFLYEVLQNHSEVFIPKVKELNFFSFNHLKKNSYYKAFKIGNEKKYLSYYSKAKHEKYLLDSSVSYFNCPDAPKNIYNFNSDSKIIIITRDPVERAYSHYLMDYRMGYVKKTFYKYISNPDKYPKQYEQYIGISNYSKHIANFVNIFGEKNVLVISLKNKVEGYKKITTFLGIKNNLAIDFDKKINPGKIPKNFIASYFQKNRNITERLKIILPKQLVKKVNGILYNKNVEMKMSLEELQLTNEILKDEISKYYEKLNGK